MEHKKLLDPAGISESDRSLLRRVEFGDLDAMLLLYDRHSAAVYTAALTALNTASQAEEILIEVFMRVWRGPQSFHVYQEQLRLGLSMLSRRQARLTHKSRLPSRDLGSSDSRN